MDKVTKIYTYIIICGFIKYKALHIYSDILHIEKHKPLDLHTQNAQRNTVTLKTEFYTNLQDAPAQHHSSCMQNYAKIINNSSFKANNMQAL